MSAQDAELVRVFGVLDGLVVPTRQANLDNGRRVVAGAVDRPAALDAAGGGLRIGEVDHGDSLAEKEEAGSRFDAQSLAGGHRGEPASGELLPIAQPPHDDTAEAGAVGGQMTHSDGRDDA